MLRSLGDSTASDYTPHFTIHDTLPLVLQEIRFEFGRRLVLHHTSALGDVDVAHANLVAGFLQFQLTFLRDVFHTSAHLGWNPSIAIHRFTAVDVLPSPGNTCLAAITPPSQIY